MHLAPGVQHAGPQAGRGKEKGTERSVTAGSRCWARTREQQ